MGQAIVLTKSEDLSPIPTAPAVIERRVSGTRTHLSCRQSGEVNVGPLLFDGLAVSTSHTGRVIEGVLNLTFWPMRGQVELGHKVRDGES